MKTKSIISQPNEQQSNPPPTTAAPVAAEPPASRTPMSKSEFADIVLPLTAFLAANSSTELLKPHSGSYWGSHEPASSELQVRFRLDPRFFREETALDQPLMALLRANSRGCAVGRAVLRVSLELFYKSVSHSYYHYWAAALVISACSDAQREPCLERVNYLLRTVLRPGYIRPLTDDEREELGRCSIRSRR